MELSLNDKRAVVCGSTQGIGNAAAHGLANLGASITLIARNEDALKKTCDDLNKSGGQQHDYIVADFSKPEELREKIQTYTSSNQVHILINNTGGPPGGLISEAKTEEFQNAFSNHLICNHILTQAVLEGMKKDNYGRIINVISTSVKQPLNGLGVSNTVRGAVANWAKTMANELGQFGITVNNVLPGATNTGRLQSIISNKAVKLNSSEEEISKKMLAEIPAARFAEPEEIGNVIAFLASPAASYVNGINVPVDGGRTGCL